MYKKKGFTLIELLVVMSVIAILASFVFVSLEGARERARIVKTLQWSQSMYSLLAIDAVGIWNFNNRTAEDSSGSGNHGTIHGGAVFVDDTPSGEGWALQFDGVNDYVSVSSSGFNISQGSYELWFKPNELPFPAWDTLIHHEIPSVNHNAINIAGISGRSTIAFHVSNAAGIPMGGWFRLESRVLTVGSWYHIVTTWNATTGETKLYINGELDDSLIGTEFPTVTALNIGIGKNLVHAGREVNGLIDEVRIYERALTASEIQKRYAEGLKRLNLAGK